MVTSKTWWSDRRPKSLVANATWRTIPLALLLDSPLWHGQTFGLPARLPCYIASLFPPSLRTWFQPSLSLLPGSRKAGQLTCVRWERHVFTYRTYMWGEHKTQKMLCNKTPKTEELDHYSICWDHSENRGRNSSIRGLKACKKIGTTP